MAEAPETAETLPSAEEAQGWIGFRLEEIGGSGVGRVQGILVDAASQEPVWLVVKLGRFGKLTAVPVSDCAAGAGSVWIAHSRDVVRKGPALEGGKSLTREDELQICGHYGIGEEHGRAADVFGRPDGAVTAQPPGAADDVDAS